MAISQGFSFYFKDLTCQYRVYELVGNMPLPSPCKKLSADPSPSLASQLPQEMHAILETAFIL